MKCSFYWYLSPPPNDNETMNLLGEYTDTKADKSALECVPKMYRSPWILQGNSYTFDNLTTSNCLIILHGYDSYSQGALLVQRAANGLVSTTSIINIGSLHFSATIGSDYHLICTCDDCAQGAFYVLNL